MVDTNEPDGSKRSFTHPDFDDVWARFERAEVPFVAHVAVNGHYEPVSKSFRNNGRQTQELGGDAPAGEVGLVTIKNSAEIFLTAMVFDGVFDSSEDPIRFRTLPPPDDLEIAQVAARVARRIGCSIASSCSAASSETGTPPTSSRSLRAS